MSSQFRQQHIVVTGGAGFIGINLVLRLLESGAFVTVIDKVAPPEGVFPPSVEVIQADILTDMDIIRKTLIHCDYCFHLAAKTDLDGKSLQTYRVNYDGTANLLNLLVENKNLKRFILFSTQLVVGLFDETRFIDEAEPYRTKTLYGQSKILAEKETIKLCAQHSIPYTIIRPTSVYGPHCREPFRDFFHTIQKGYYFHIGKAHNLVSLVYVKNLVEQTIFLAGEEKANGLICFGADLYPYTMRQFADAVAGFFGIKLFALPDFVVTFAAYFLGFFKWLGVNVPLYPFRLRNLKANYCYSIKNVLALGFIPQYQLEEGIQETLQWFVENDSLFSKS